MALNIFKKSNWTMTDQPTVIGDSDFKDEMNLGQNYHNFSAGFVINPIPGMIENDDEYKDRVSKAIKYFTFTFEQPIEDKFSVKFGK